jgi:hypothetical protein
VLDIDTDLDAVVTKENAAAAIDKYITLKHLFTAEHGVINFLTEDGVVINNGRDTENYVLAKNASMFVDGSSVLKTSLGSGTAVDVLLNAKGEIAYIAGSSLMLQQGATSYADGKVTANAITYNVDLNVVVGPLPNQLDNNFTFDNFARYTGAGTSFMGNTYINTKTDEITKLNLYISKIADRTVKVTGTNITADYSDVALDNQTFAASADIVVTLQSSKEGEKGKVVTLAEIEALQNENTLAGTLEINSIGEITAITVKATVKEKQK